MPIWRKEHEVARVVVHYIGIIGTALSTLAAVRQISSRPSLYDWGRFGGMSLPTALVLMAYGVAVYLVSRGEATHAGGRR